MSLSAELGSIATTIEQLIDRIEQMSASVDGTAREDLSLGLADVERNLRAGARRLERLLRDIE